MAFTYDYFGANPVAIIMQTGSQFDGAAFGAVTPVINKGVVTFPIQAGGGRLDFHKRPLIIHGIHVVSQGGSGTISVVHSSGVEVILETFSNSNLQTHDKHYLPVGSYLKLVTSGGSGTKVAQITATEAYPGGGL